MVIRVRNLPSTVQAALRAIGYLKPDISVSRRSAWRMSGGVSGSGTRAITCLLDLNTGQHEEHYGSWGGENMFTRAPADVDNTERTLSPNIAVLQGSNKGPSSNVDIAVHPETYDAWSTQNAASHHRYLSSRASSGDAAAAAQLVRADEALERGEGLTSAVGTASLTDLEQAVLEAHGGLTSAGRKNEFERWENDAAWNRSWWKGSPVTGTSHREKSADARRQINAAVDSLVARGLLKKNKAGAVAITTEGKNARKSRY